MTLSSFPAQLIIGVIVGAGVVGSSVLRTLHVHKKEEFKAITQSILNSFFYFLSVYWIANDNIVAFSGSVIGSTAIVYYLATKGKIHED